MAGRPRTSVRYSDSAPSSLELSYSDAGGGEQALASATPGSFPGEQGGERRGWWCFVAGTPTLTRDGRIPIERVGIGTLLAGISPSRRERFWAEVTAVHAALTCKLVVIRLEREAIACTAHHPFLELHRGWTQAGLLFAGDTLLDWHLRPVRVVAVEHVSLPQPVPVYGITVGQVGTYLVGQSELLVHNKFRLD